MPIKKILIVDDSLTDLSNLKNILSVLDCEIITANDGKVAIEKAQSEKPDIIFMDIVMEQMDGYEAARTITNGSSTKTIPLIFVSSKKQKADRVWAKMQGAKELISKPYTAEQIMEQIKNYG